MTICARYLNKERNCIEEPFLGFVPVQDQTSLAEEIIKFLIETGIDMKNIRGQRYDGASSMAGNMNGVQAAVPEKYKSALYIHALRQPRAQPGALHCLLGRGYTKLLWNSERNSEFFQKISYALCSARHDRLYVPAVAKETAPRFVRNALGRKA